MQYRLPMAMLSVLTGEACDSSKGGRVCQEARLVHGCAGGRDRCSRYPFGPAGGDAASIAERLKPRTQGVRLLPLVYKSHSLVTIVIAEHRERNEAIRLAIDEQLNGAT